MPPIGYLPDDDLLDNRNFDTHRRGDYFMDTRKLRSNRQARLSFSKMFFDPCPPSQFRSLQVRPPPLLFPYQAENATKSKRPTQHLTDCRTFWGNSRSHSGTLQGNPIGGLLCRQPYRRIRRLEALELIAWPASGYISTLATWRHFLLLAF